MKQHYIPRCYLRRFSDIPKSIFTYDKLNCKKYSASMMAVCCKDDMYTISDSYVEENNSQQGGNINNLTLEHDHFAKFIEPNLNQLLHSIDEIKNEWISGKGRYRLKFEEKRELALHLVTQYFRLPQLQESTVDNYLRMEKANIDMVKSCMAILENNPAYNDLKIDVKSDVPALHANLTYLDDDTLMMFADAIAQNIWIFLVSEKDEFYTSDFPIVVEPHVQQSCSSFMGLAQYGGELTYPLSPDLMLVVFDRKYFHERSEEDCSFIITDAKEIRRQNMLRYFYANQHVFSLNNDFKLIDFIYKVEGHHIFQRTNHKMEIVSGLGRY